VPKNLTGGLGFVVLAGSIGGHFNKGDIIPEDALPEERMAQFIARGIIRPASQADVDAYNAIPTGLAAVGSTDEGAMTPTALVEQERAVRESQIDNLQGQIDELKRQIGEDLPVQMKHAQLQEAAMEEADLIVAETGHSGAASTADNTSTSGATVGGGEPSEPVDPKKQTAAERRASGLSVDR
jgi:hypothetical protein